MKTTRHIVFLALIAAGTYAQTTYFLVAPYDPAHRRDSYILPLTSGTDIAHARALIEYGPAAGQPIVVCNIACCPDGINHDYLSPVKKCWNWHITEFVGFADYTIEILDGWPGLVNNGCLKTGSCYGTIGFWTYTVVAELGTDPIWVSCDYDISNDKLISLDDFSRLASRWMEDNCLNSAWCGGADLNHDGVVNDIDLLLLAGVWLSPHTVCPIWFEAWECPTQCYGDANCTADGGIIKYRVSTPDLAMYMAAWGSKPWPVKCGDFNYNPAIDFDRDCDIDETDGAILETWYHRADVPADCPTAP
ncbi:MAG TPA: hypothetical protein PKB02_15200 [Anaerohalosphaeraceae bacterium]|nr:hypothetical protein [Anaerohalosphaeraceae bacterium]